ncbi:MFS transporter [Bacillus sp. JJ1521]|uniref:MFS transporter n=1 Tax=Bacillus sp. JJ1521 TaxID=3122957 RepID=UPI002FFEB4B4
MRWTILILLFFGVMINFADKSVAGLSAVYLMDEFKLSYGQWGVIGSIFYVIFPLAALGVGALTDKMGPKKVLGYMLLSWSIIQMGGFFIAGFIMLLMYRFLLGVTEGGYAPAAFKQLFSWFPPESRGKINSIYNAGAVAGGFIMSPLIVYLLQSVGWRMTFVVLGVSSLVLYILWITIVPKENPNIHIVSPDQVSNPENKISRSELWSVLRSSSVIFSVLATFTCFIYVVWSSTWMPLHLIKVVNISESAVGFAISGIGISSVIIGIILATASDRLFKKTQDVRKSRIIFTGVSMIIGALMVASTYFIQAPIWVVIALGLGNGLCVTFFSISHILLSSQLPEKTATLSGLLIASGNVAGIFAPLLTGFIIESASNEIQGFNNSLLFIAITLLVVALLFTIFAKPGKPRDLNNNIEITNTGS